MGSLHQKGKHIVQSAHVMGDTFILSLRAVFVFVFSVLLAR